MPSRATLRALAIGAVICVAGVLLAVALRTPPVERLPALAERPVTNIAHAGAQAVAPENTMPAFEQALALGADVLEMDLQLSADGHVMVIHDGTVDRTTDGSGRVVDLTRQQLQTLDAGYGFEGPDGSFPFRGHGVSIPALEQVFAAFPDTFVIVELKTDSGPQIVPAVADLIERHGRGDGVLVSSFDAAYLQAFREQAPGVATNLAEDEVRTFYALHLFGLHRWWSPPGRVVQVPETDGGRRIPTHRFVAAADDLGLDVQVFTVNETPDMARLVATGVRGIITDRPGRLADLLATELPPVPVPSGDASLARTLQAELAFLEPVMRALALLGDEEFYLLVFPLLYWCVHRALGLRIGLVMLVSAGLNSAAKLAFASPRPFVFDPGAGLIVEESFGIPSGHAQNGVAVWGVAAADLRRWWAWAVAVVLVTGISLSRLYLGVHFPIDVVVGWLLGVVVLTGFLVLWGPAVARLARLSPIARVTAAVGGSLVLLAVGVVARLGRLGWEAPAGWVDVEGVGSDLALDLSGVVTAAGALAGVGVGLVVLHEAGGFSVAGRWWRRAVRYPLGLVGVAIFWLGLGALFPDGESSGALVLRYVRYGLVGAWVGGIAPLLFVRLGLAEAAEGSPARSAAANGPRLTEDPSGAGTGRDRR